MLRLGRRRRDVAAQALREAANLVIGALVVGQFLGRAPTSPWQLVFGGVMWLLLGAAALPAPKRKTMDNVLILLSTVTVLGLILGIVMNVVGNRQDRQAKQRRTS